MKFKENFKSWFTNNKGDIEALDINGNIMFTIPEDETHEKSSVHYLITSYYPRVEKYNNA